MNVINITPQPASRPRVSKNGTYNTSKYTNYKEALSIYLRKQNKCNIIADKPISLDIVFYMPIPKSISLKNKKELIGKPHIKKPDLDNLLKAFKDSANKILYTDDSLVANVTASKLYSNNPSITYDINIID